MVKECDDTFAAVFKTIYSYESEKVPRLDVSNIKQPVLWINGFHDFLMGGESIDSSSETPITVFHHSGHYPHIEEPERFRNELINFLEGHSSR